MRWVFNDTDALDPCQIKNNTPNKQHQTRPRSLPVPATAAAAAIIIMSHPPPRVMRSGLGAPTSNNAECDVPLSQAAIILGTIVAFTARATDWGMTYTEHCGRRKMCTDDLRRGMRAQFVNAGTGVGIEAVTYLFRAMHALPLLSDADVQTVFFAEVQRHVGAMHRKMVLGDQSEWIEYCLAGTLGAMDDGDDDDDDDDDDGDTDSEDMASEDGREPCACVVCAEMRLAYEDPVFQNEQHAEGFAMLKSAFQHADDTYQASAAVSMIR